MSNKTQDLAEQAERLQEAIASLLKQIEQIEENREVAPVGCCVLRYQAQDKQSASKS